MIETQYSYFSDLPTGCKIVNFCLTKLFEVANLGRDSLLRMSRLGQITESVTKTSLRFIWADQCLLFLQWTYVAGNNWGNCPDGSSGLGCGPQEHFRSCADIQIV